jgi:hypothetical protein
MARKHSNEAFYALYDPLEAAIFSVLAEMMKEMDKADHKNDENEITSFPQS